MKFQSDRYPHLLVKGADYRVQFRDGQADVTQKSEIDGLKGLPESVGVRALRPAKES